MEDNYYIMVSYEFETKCKGLHGNFKGHKTIHHKYLEPKYVDELIEDIKKYIKEYNACIELHIDNLYWYGDSITHTRFLHQYDGIYVVTWPNKYEDGVKAKISTREIKKYVHAFIDEFDEYVNTELTKEEN